MTISVLSVRAASGGAEAEVRMEIADGDRVQHVGGTILAALFSETGLPWQIKTPLSIDKETWSDRDGDKGRRAWLQELWFRYCTEEFTPLMLQMNGTHQAPITMGCSMGATHALNTFLRRPDLFHGVIALSGAYDARYFFGDYMDSNLYNNSIVDYMAGIALDHAYIPMFNARAIYVCTGQGAWEEEMIRTTTMVRKIFEEKGIRAFIDFWGRDVDHDWPWWRRQFPYFLNKIL